MLTLTSADDVGFVVGPYSHADNDPLNGIDPLGLSRLDDDLISPRCIAGGLVFSGSIDYVRDRCEASPDNATPVTSEVDQLWFYEVDVIHRALYGELRPPEFFTIFKYTPVVGRAFERTVVVPGPGNNDQCSAPIAEVFTLACDMHDYGYDLVRAATYAGVPDEWAKWLRLKADDVFHEVAGLICGEVEFYNKPLCYTERSAAYRFLTVWSKAEGVVK